MSYILDALKKLEQEKAARRNAEINISDEITRENRQIRRTVKRSLPVSTVLAALGVLLLIGVSGVFLWHGKGADKQAPAVAVKPERMPPAAAVAAADAQPAARPLPTAPPARPVAAVPEEEAPPRPREDKRSLHGARYQAQTALHADTRPRSEEPDREESGSRGSAITVSGIAWQDAPSARRAVINGELLQEGAQVGGAKVVEILPTRVRFSSGGRRFSVSISGPLVTK